MLGQPDPSTRAFTRAIDDDELAPDEVFEGDIVVDGAGTLRLRGTLDGDLTVRTGGFVVVYGRVTGDVVNSGGRVLVYGAIEGALRRRGGLTYVDPEARVALRTRRAGTPARRARNRSRAEIRSVVPLLHDARRCN